MKNPYPKTRFCELSNNQLVEVDAALRNAGFNPDRVYAHWVRDIWDTTYRDALEEVGEWLANITIYGNAVANELKIVEGAIKLKRGEMPE